MDSIAKDNANPTILSVSELPTRRQKRTNRGESSEENVIRELLMAKPSYAMDPFYMSDFSDTDSDDSTVEPIDEQEIYGELTKASVSVDNPSLCSLPAQTMVLSENIHLVCKLRLRMIPRSVDYL